MTGPHACQCCGKQQLEEVAGFATLPRVTSDSKPYPAGGRLTVCMSCGLVQKLVDDTWLREIGEIYRNYEMYHHSDNIDQLVFDPQSGAPTPRCAVLARRLIASGAIPEDGRLLDVGAGSGAMLGAFSAATPRWSLYGLDLDDRKERMLKAIPRFEQLYTVEPEAMNRTFDLLTLIHSLEHFTAPVDMLRKLRRLIAPGGKLFIEVNDVERTPFDIVVADHLSHFSPASLARTVAAAGFSVHSNHTDWVNKELSLIATADAGTYRVPAPPPENVLEAVRQNVRWLADMLSDALRAGANVPFGIFGTSIAGTWLASALGDRVTFFVDEDTTRENRLHMGRPILAPANAPAGATVYLAFPRAVAASISSRLAALPLRFVQAPEAAASR